MQNTFERKKQELLASQSASAAEGETNLAGQPSQLTEMDIWVCNLLVERQKEELKRHKNKRMRRELDLLKKHVYNISSSNGQSSQEDNQAYEDESGDDSDSMNDNGSGHDSDIMNKSKD
ncbi:hypothetical protein RDI58_026987 [Solanum bulbocastanum]|uniref:Uncharacterized protein n=1 Tax=Solanum bulbocastanum TaxID=147425 RepID=A0AAN8T2K4_SOLBU